MTYLDWNNALAAHFFRPDFADQPIYLYVTPELISALGADLGTDGPDFATAVQTGPPWVTREGLCQRALQSFRGWRDRELRYPPYIGYIGFFVLAAGTEGDWAPHAYYPRVWQLLGQHREGMLPSFERMDYLWEDLERWSRHDRSGELGFFRARSAGGWIHVGYPIAQTLLTQHERSAIPSIFALAGLDPTSPPSEVQIARLVRQHAGSLLRNRTVELLGRPETEAFGALIDVIRHELLDWRGELPNADGEAESSPQVLATLRLCLRLDAPGQAVRTTLRCRLNRDYPEGELLVSDGQETLVLEEFTAGWSTNLRTNDDDSPFDASNLSWSVGATYEEKNLGWRFRLPPATVRVLVPGAREGLPGLVEANELPRNESFHLLYSQSAWTQLEEWAKTDCEDFKELTVLHGMPSGWHLASVTSVKDDSKVRSRFPTLNFPQQLRVVLTGGIRSSPGAYFFAFAPPRVSVFGGDGSEQVFYNEEELPRGSEGSFVLPADAPLDTRLLIEVQRLGSTERTQSLYLTEDVMWRFSEPLYRFDSWGLEAASEEQGISGAGIGAPDVTHGYTHSALTLPELHRTKKAYLVGRGPGQVVRWPEDPIPSDWDPVWAIVEKRGRKILYCGQALSESRPMLEKRSSSKREVRRWKELLTRRRRVRLPENPAVRTLWKDFREAAQGV